MDTTFSDDEKRFVLAEMIKVSTIDIHTLVNFIKAHSVEPNWMSMQLPGGRNMNQCLGAVDNMFQAKFAPPNLTSFKRKSLSDLADHHTKRQAIMAPVEPPLAPARVIQPRPPPPNGYSPAPSISNSPAATMMTTTTMTTTGKKRGRPSKADKEAQAQARAAYSRPTEYAPITPAPLAPLQPQREFASSPGYEIASSSIDQNPRKRPRPNPVGSPRQASSAFHLASPASTTGTPRALPEPLEQVERANLSPHDRGSVSLDSRSPPLPPYMQQELPPPHAHLQPRTQPPVPIQPSPRPPQTYDHYRGPDPIFPDRDRSRSMPDQLPRDVPASPVVNRS